MPGFEAMEENICATLAVFGRASRSGETRAFSGVTTTSSGIRFSMFNSAILTSPVSNPVELEHRIRTAASFFANRKLEWSFWVCQAWVEYDMRPLVGAIFDAGGMRLVVDLPGMECARLAAPGRRLPSLAFRPVSEAAARAEFSRIMSVAFGIPLQIARAVYESERTWNDGFAGYIGDLDGVPVTTAATFTTASTVGVYAVATIPGHQRRGYAEAVVRHALDQTPASAGGCPSVLQSSDAGFSLYRRMGYRTTTRYAVFASA